MLEMNRINLWFKNVKNKCYVNEMGTLRYFYTSSWSFMQLDKSDAIFAFICNRSPDLANIAVLWLSILNWVDCLVLWQWTWHSHVYPISYFRWLLLLENGEFCHSFNACIIDNNGVICCIAYFILFLAGGKYHIFSFLYSILIY